MAQIDKWKCDICGDTYEKGDAGYSNRHPLKIEVYKGLYEGLNGGKEVIYYGDVCFNCRDKIYGAIDKTIADCMK